MTFVLVGIVSAQYSVSNACIAIVSTPPSSLVSIFMIKRTPSGFSADHYNLIAVSEFTNFTNCHQ